MSADRVVYLDSSAIVKLIVREPETAALRRYVRRRRPLVASALARAEVCRAVLPLGDAALKRARAVLAHIDLVRISDRVLTRAGTIKPSDVRTLDAIHLATASLLADSLTRFVCYDSRLSRAAESHGWTVDAPR